MLVDRRLNRRRLSQSSARGQRRLTRHLYELHEPATSSHALHTQRGNEQGDGHQATPPRTTALISELAYGLLVSEGALGGGA